MKYNKNYPDVPDFMRLSDSHKNMFFQGFLVYVYKNNILHAKYGSVREAARKIGVSYDAMKALINKDGKYNGYTFVKGSVC
jgi:hypothetical protein